MKKLHKVLVVACITLAMSSVRAKSLETAINEALQAYNKGSIASLTVTKLESLIKRARSDANIPPLAIANLETILHHKNNPGLPLGPTLPLIPAATGAASYEPDQAYMASAGPGGAAGTGPSSAKAAGAGPATPGTTGLLEERINQVFTAFNNHALATVPLGVLQKLFEEAFSAGLDYGIRNNLLKFVVFKQVPTVSEQDPSFPIPPLPLIKVHYPGPKKNFLVPGEDYSPHIIKASTAITAVQNAAIKSSSTPPYSHFLMTTPASFSGATAVPTAVATPVAVAAAAPTLTTDDAEHPRIDPRLSAAFDDAKNFLKSIDELSHSEIAAAAIPETQKIEAAGKELAKFLAAWSAYKTAIDSYTTTTNRDTRTVNLNLMTVNLNIMKEALRELHRLEQIDQVEIAKKMLRDLIG